MLFREDGSTVGAFRMQMIWGKQEKTGRHVLPSTFERKLIIRFPK
jgi:hypothetical protein